jgi:hypothetical protein
MTWGAEIVCMAPSEGCGVLQKGYRFALSGEIQMLS